MPTAVVTGANSGIGHSFAQLLVHDGYEVFAADINVGENLKTLGCHAEQLDVTSDISIRGFADKLKDKPIDLLLNIAGIMVPKEQDALESVSQSVLDRTFAVNTYGPLLLTQALLPNVLQSSQPRLGFMSSRVGSIADNSSGGSYAYRASKAALNSICKSLAVELRHKGVVVVIMHPGYVKTSLSPESHKLPEAVEPDEAAGKLWKVLMKVGIEDTGKFWHREGFELEW